MDDTVMWQWANHEATDDGSMPAEDSADWMDITGANAASYTPVDADEGMFLRATATYTDGLDSGNVEMAVSASAVTQFAITTGPSEVDDHPENTTAVATYTASGTNAASSSWSVTGGADAGLFRIPGGVLTFNTAPDYENPADTGGDNVYNVTVEADDGTATVDLDVEITVADVDEPASVTGLPASAMVGDVLTASLSDPDMGATATAWSWDRAGTVIATSASYTVAEEDAGMSLEVTATYDDVHGTDKMVSGTVMVNADTADTVAGYDTNGTPGIQIDELFKAIDDYFHVDIELNIDDLFDVIDAYFANNG